MWTRVLLDDEWVLLDASFGLEASTDGAAVGVLPLKLGQEFDLIAPSDRGRQNRTCCWIFGSVLTGVLAWRVGEPVLG